MTHSSCFLVLAARNVDSETDAALFVQLVQEQLAVLDPADLPVVIEQLQNELKARSAVMTSVWTAMMLLQRKHMQLERETPAAAE